MRKSLAYLPATRRARKEGESAIQILSGWLRRWERVNLRERRSGRMRISMTYIVHMSLPPVLLLPRPFEHGMVYRRVIWSYEFVEC